MRLLLLLALLSFNAFGHDTDDAPPPLTAYFSAIIVQDIDSAIAWYSKKLGFELVNRVDMPKRGFSQANLKRQGALIELIQTNKTLNPKDLLAGKPKKTKIGGFFKLGFQVADFDVWVKWLKKVKVNFYGSVVKDPVSGKRTVLLLDPDGNRIQLFEH